MVIGKITNENEFWGCKKHNSTGNTFGCPECEKEQPEKDNFVRGLIVGAVIMFFCWTLAKLFIRAVV